MPLQSLYRKGITVFGYAGLLVPDQTLDAALHDVLRALAAGQLTVPVDSAIPFAEVNEAFERIRQRAARGKIVLTA